MADDYTGAVTVGGPSQRRDLGGLTLDKVQVGPLENNVYFLECKDTGDVLLIDAAHSPPYAANAEVVLSQRVYTNFSAQNLELNIMRFPVCDSGCGCGSGCGGGAYDTCGCNSG